MKHIYLLFLLTISFGFSQIPSDYYDSANGLTGYALKTQLKNIISAGHVDQGYGALYTGYLTTDNDDFFEDDDTVLDMYSERPSASDPYNYDHDTNGGSPGGDACGNFNGEGQCYNREHLFPQGFFDSANPMRTDIHHVVPTDGRVNGFRSNFPFGEVGTNLVSQNGITNPTQNGSKLGNCISPGYTGTVFEPIDEFKGDIARMLLYFAVRYEDNWDDSGWDSHTVPNNPLNGTSDQFYETWYINLLYKWHTEDPVSPREIARNTAAYNFQGNANPFIDHPEYVLEAWFSVLSIDNFQQAEIKIYPNPVSGNEITITSTQDILVEVYDVLGKRVKQQNIIANHKKLNIAGLKKGIYLLRLKTDSGTITKKLIRQ
ncbi:endonuclease [Winogradskyella haliclonae]|uniref:Secretion system C-terminal sorting domain-containing protein n=1 Tax=Winogradskyella haliclonae TaxID=2048558 RepID=A0ABQ2C0A1_9FLAO|nr:endonuclease [Winogradskyella haliclonae]GGI57941.1 hypothetical protein GCM10011444_22500 [Winogradskyella haliclonae]